MLDILVVDDNEITVRALDQLLSKEGFNIISASNGKDAIRLLDQLKFDLVVTDLLMPFTNGIDLIRYVKSDAAKMNTPIIVVSSIKDEKSKMECYNLGVDVYLTKPVTPVELVMMIRKLTRN
jgi:DNA-binding response OmpR family regulator